MKRFDGQKNKGGKDIAELKVALKLERDSRISQRLRSGIGISTFGSF